eukprot:scaffold8089_cov93-Isochrysis_galbana.AAC.1
MRAITERARHPHATGKIVADEGGRDALEVLDGPASLVELLREVRRVPGGATRKDMSSSSIIADISTDDSFEAWLSACLRQMVGVRPKGNAGNARQRRPSPWPRRRGGPCRAPNLAMPGRHPRLLALENYSRPGRTKKSDSSSQKPGVSSGKPATVPTCSRVLAMKATRASYAASSACNGVAATSCRRSESSQKARGASSMMTRVCAQ